MKYSRRDPTTRLSDRTFPIPYPLTCPTGGGAQKGFEEASVEAVAVEEKLRMPLDAEKEAMSW